MTGFKSKREMAEDKLLPQKDFGDALTIAYKSGYYDGKKAAQPAQEPVAHLCGPDENGLFGLPTADKACKDCFPVYTTPPQRKPLTDEELDLICEKALFCRISFQQFARSIEAVHGIKE